MSTQPLFYKKVVPLSKDQHSNYSVEPVKNYSFTKNTNSLYIAAIEFLRASKEYLIVFTKSKDDTLFPVVILGLKNNQNLYIDKKGKWLANYIPAYIRRYPFILAKSNDEGGNFAVCVDKSFSGFNNKNKGQQLFDSNGGESNILKQSVAFLQEYQNHIQLTALFTKTLLCWAPDRIVTSRASALAPCGRTGVSTANGRSSRSSQPPTRGPATRSGSPWCLMVISR